MAQSPLLRDPWTLLAQHDSLLRNDIIGSELVLDLVEPMVADSIVDARRQHLKGFGGWFIHHTWARYWEYYTDHKQKYVATNCRDYHIFNGPGDEIDINIFLMPHLPRYVARVKDGFERALDRDRSLKGFRFDKPSGYPLPEELRYQDFGCIVTECEVTPPHEFSDRLEHAFLPVRDGVYALDTLKFFGCKHPSMGMTGVWCMDCNHNCRPEIHPIEWLWWLDLSKERPGTPIAKSWMVALIVDDSHRFKDWSAGPLSGEIAIPFVVPTACTTIIADLQKIAGDPIANDTLPPGEFYQSADTSFVIPYLPGTGEYPKLDILVRTSGEWPQTGTRYWFSDISTCDTGWKGYLHIATTVQNLLAMRVTIDGSRD